ncbi:hypothetical protein EJ05DRAFT_309841 [Pseudovirgaria hyperparasitica]|uniref:Uncharacterized protein n=1 Tax=Pseudovirgaria hyperparasitica TaxID=470096 RepID=A0A6A6WAA7_9PEZI|nr:uncharacterized protein EJ05DRAFT_309841 [Pseudovirgaria hyperparasitica]KAF2759792.1 hypothetical protein EJ05DRAFT_309841 [Pseudovirgaria hyperparasitica]
MLPPHNFVLSVVILLELICKSVSTSCNSTESLPNPIATTYPNETTGTINGTHAIIPIDLSAARSLIPPQYGINLYELYALQPDFPRNKYPLIVQSVLDHDVGVGTSLRIPDFTRSAITLPFVDLLHDGRTSFRLLHSIVMSDNPLAVEGAALYGPPQPLVGRFDPPCEAYMYETSERTAASSVTFAAYPLHDDVHSKRPLVHTRFKPCRAQPYSLALYENILNQVLTNNGTLCDNFVTLFDTSISTGDFSPVPVEGRVVLNRPVYPTDSVFEGVFGIKADFAFVERNYIPCSQFKSVS